MKTYPHLFSKLFCQPLMLNEPVRHSLEAALLSHMGIAAPQAAVMPQESKTQRVARILETYGNVAVVHMDGVIDKHISQFEMDCYGGYDIADFDRALQAVAADPKIQRVVLNINSPGGSVIGVAEAAARVAELTATKEVHAFVDAMACSAAYYIARQADHIAAAPSAIVGCIGVYLSLLDAHRNTEMQGYKVTLITAGKYKAMGSPYKTLSDEERAMMQAGVTDLHAQFKAAVRSGRRGATERGGHATVPDSAMEGQWMDAKDGLAARLVDELTNANLDEYVAALLT